MINIYYAFGSECKIAGIDAEQKQVGDTIIIGNKTYVVTGRIWKDINDPTTELTSELYIELKMKNEK